MNKLFWLLVIIMSAFSCRKETAVSPSPTLPNMNYVDFNDRLVKFNHSLAADVNGDGVKDISFSTLAVGDPILKRDYMQYMISSSIFTFLPVNNDQHIPILSKEASISSSSYTGYEWNNASSILLVQKVTGETGSQWWDGEWKAASHKYVPIQVNKNNLLYYGWIDISFDTIAENIIVHKAAICKEAGKEVKAGL